MIPPIPNLQDYGLSENNGFLPNETPLDHLSSCYYNPWEDIAANLPVLAKTKRIRRAIDGLPLLDTFELKNEAEWRRAYVILGFLTHAYIWGGDEPSEVCMRHPNLVL
jgi:indoleamine 2,3-dioxygenase